MRKTEQSSVHWHIWLAWKEYSRFLQKIYHKSKSFILLSISSLVQSLAASKASKAIQGAVTHSSPCPLPQERTVSARIIQSNLIPKVAASAEVVTSDRVLFPWDLIFKNTCQMQSWYFCSCWPQITFYFNSASRPKFLIITKLLINYQSNEIKPFPETNKTKACFFIGLLAGWSLHSKKP